MLENAVAFSHSLLKQTVVTGDTVIDATVGNGNDTILLASLTGKNGKVIGFDIQEEALEKTRKKLLLAGLLPQTDLHLASHEQAVDFLSEGEQIGGIIFNLGYLPGGNKAITTQKESTIKSISSLLPFLRTGSLLIVVVYSGHPAGAAEKDAVLEYTAGLDQQQYHVLLYQFLNQKNSPPFVIAIEKKK